VFSINNRIEDNNSRVHIRIRI